MAKVIVYTKDYCFYCSKAKNLLKKKGASFEEINITFDYELQEFVYEKSGRTTVPQIFIDDRPVGEADELFELNASGELDKLLKFQEG